MPDIVTTLAQALTSPPLELLSQHELTAGPTTGRFELDNPEGYGLVFTMTTIPIQFGYLAGAENVYYQWLCNWSLQWFGRTTINDNVTVVSRQYWPLGGQPLLVGAGGRLVVQFAPGVYGRIYALRL